MKRLRAMEFVRDVYRKPREPKREVG